MVLHLNAQLEGLKFCSEQAILDRATGGEDPGSTDQTELPPPGVLPGADNSAPEETAVWTAVPANDA